MKESFGKYLLSKEQFDHFRYLSENLGFQVVRNNGGYKIKKDDSSVLGNALNYSFDSYFLDLSSSHFRNSLDRDFLIGALNEVLRQPKHFFVKKKIYHPSRDNRPILRPKRGAIYNPVTFNGRVFYIKHFLGEDSFAPKRRIASLSLAA